MENIIAVDLDDKLLGKVEKLDAHKTPILHRAFSIFLFNGDEILIQKRALNKYHSGGLWANACCSHPRFGKTMYESTIDRIGFELGIFEPIELREIFKFVYFSKYNENLYEYEYDHVFVGEYKNKDIKFNPDEIECIKWIKIGELKKDIVLNPNKYATWFIICAPKAFEYIEKNHLHKN